jgi:hypothetical protein
MKKYCGIGSRQTPSLILEIMEEFGYYAAKKSYRLLSGGAAGADSAFEKGCKAYCSEHNKPLREYMTIFLPHDEFQNKSGDGEAYISEIDDYAYDIAKKHHPVWNRLSSIAKRLMARNTYQVLDKTLDSPVDFVICWTPDGAKHQTTIDTGGTGQAIRIAIAHKVPVYNLADLKDHKNIMETLEWMKR